jgi:hypothetical protein
MQFDLMKGKAILARTPGVLDTLLYDLPAPWIEQREGPDTWSPLDVVGHLIHGERADWIPRARILLEHGPARAFDPFDRFAQFEESRGKTMPVLLDEFATLRRENLAALDALRLTPADLARTGRHPDFGVVTLGELLSTWVVHDLGHIAQITRAMASGYVEAVGPWAVYLPVLARSTAK